ncbi:MAG: 4Fe-4S dicluster domain-containing protein [Verrucomicrobia bacterium]|nr:4Fe-4S dicluster domain-containing protein [Verrucomicrobiota bacterium]MBU4246892.1 4Fe-4S dicluster domain-containing protein [Verrucomicrobiota bacterium]MBU4290829.1 4Fe-4S dicluster domain-containing protein [Verrucomicrobiota bacterium]MBU4496565.1 4Fe-4S dicluster domain-containing protein [Verrucomicrobiota bacterium]MCG2680548.1 4Fe-4S dicluster domain-containing protein [Kiritimatiellia bacterium]
MDTIHNKDLDPKFKDDVAACPGGENIKLCFACGTCTAACPVAFVNDQFNPRRIIRQVLMGLRKEVLSSPILWQCLQCYACYAKCPQNVKFRDVMKALRALAIKEGYVKAEVAEELARLDELIHKLQRDAANLLVADRPKYEALKKHVEECLTESKFQNPPSVRL